MSESEWEYVARAGSTTNYHSGDDIDSKKANYNDEFRGTTAVGSYPANGFGLYDIHGNAAEWVSDCSVGLTTMSIPLSQVVRRQRVRVRNDLFAVEHGIMRLNIYDRRSATATLRNLDFVVLDFE